MALVIVRPSGAAFEVVIEFDALEAALSPPADWYNLTVKI